MKKLTKAEQKENYIKAIISADITASGYKILLLLHIKPMTQAQVSELLNIQRQNVNRTFKDLKEYGLIEEERTEGKNIFFTAVTDIEKINSQIKGQLKLE